MVVARSLLSYFLGVTCFLLSNFAIAGTQEYCADEWPGDYRMREHCEEQQGEAQRKLFDAARGLGLVKDGTLSASPSGGDKEKIINKCMGEWVRGRFNTYDYRMVQHCVEQQFEAYEKVVGGGAAETSATGTKAFCSDKWPTDYRMRDHCEEQQIEANGKLFRLAEANGINTDRGLSVSGSGPGVEPIFAKCMNQWRVERFSTYDFRMVVYCLEKN